MEEQSIHDLGGRMKEHLKPLAWTAGILAVLALVGGLVTPTSMITMLTVALAVFLYFILPGYSVLLFLKLDAVERILLSVPTSAILVPIVLYFANVFGLPLSRTVVIMVCAGITALALVLFVRAKTTAPHSPQE